VQNIFPSPGALNEKVPVTVEDGSGRGAGASARWAQLISDTHLSARDGGHAALSPTTQVILSGDGTHGAQTAQYLATLFGVQVEHATPPASAGTAGTPAGTTGATTSTASAAASAASVTVILGADEERAFNLSTPSYYGTYTYSSTYTRSTTHTTTRSTTTTTTQTTTSTTSASSSSTITLPLTSSSSDSSSSTKGGGGGGGGPP